MQLEHAEIKNPTHTLNLILVLEYVQSPQNIGLIIRTAEAMGVKSIYILSQTYTQLTPKIKTISRSAEQSLDIQFFKTWKQLTPRLQAFNLPWIALEKTDRSIPFKTFNPQQSCIIFCGNEKNGISEETLSLCNTHLHIDMYGKNTSMNVAVATGILLSHIVP